MTTITIAVVKWFDASYQRGECTIDDLITRIDMTSAGILVREDEESVSIAIDNYDEIFRYISHIPKVNILEMQKIYVNLV